MPLLAVPRPPSRDTTLIFWNPDFDNLASDRNGELTPRTWLPPQYLIGTDGEVLQYFGPNGSYKFMVKHTHARIDTQ